MMSKIIFFGTESYSLIALQELVSYGVNIAAVVTKPDSVKGRGRAMSVPPVKQYALEHNIPVWQPNRLSEIEEDIKKIAPVAGVLVAYGKIIPQKIIDLFPRGIINLHPSLLPKYRGPSPIEAAMLNRDPQTGISIMALDARMDAGPVYHQETYPLSGAETREELYQTLFKRGSELLVAKLPSILNGELAAKPQIDDEASYCSLLNKNDAWLNPQTMSAAQAEAHVRAFLGFPGTRTFINDREVIITKASVSSEPSALSIEFRDGKYLAIERLKPVGKNEMTAEAFLLGYRK